MEIKTKKGLFHVNLPSSVYNKIVELADNNDKIDIGLLGFLLHDILTRKHEDKNLENGSEWVSVCSVVIKKLNFKSFVASKHLDFLVEQDVLELLPHANNIKGKVNSCKKFRLTKKYLKGSENLSSSSSSFYNKYELYNEHIAKVNMNRNIQRRGVANYKTQHLTSWLKSYGFEIEKDKAIDYINSKYYNEDDKAKKLKRLIAVSNFEDCGSKYSREGKDDRLHSYFTSLPKDLKQFITYKGQKLKEADIKNSQPFILSIILELIQEEYFNEISKFSKLSFNRFSNKLNKRLNKLINTYKDEKYQLDIRSICNSITIMLQESSVPIDFTEINAFISLIRSGDIYTFVGEQLLKAGSIRLKNGKYYVMLYNDGKGYQEACGFEGIRKCGKKVTINALYGSPKKSSVKAIEDFKSLFPEVAKYLAVLKSDDKAELPILMQRIESKCVLDYCAKKIAKKYPKMLLISIHDNLVTTESDFDMMQIEFRVLLKMYFNVDVELGGEIW